MEDTIDTPIFSISDLLNPLDFSDVPVLTPELNKNEKRWIIQRQIENILNAEDIRILNRHRYNEYLKAYKLRHNEKNLSIWLKCKDVKYKKMEKIPKKTFGIFTAKLTNEQLYRVLSECQDLYNRKGSPNLFVWGLPKRKV